MGLFRRKDDKQQNLSKKLISRIGSEPSLDQAVDIFFDVISKADPDDDESWYSVFNENVKYISCKYNYLNKNCF